MGAERHWVDKAFDQIAELTPRTGYNVVAVDSFEPPGEALYLVRHVENADEAEVLRAEHEASSGDKTYVYAARAE